MKLLLPIAFGLILMSCTKEKVSSVALPASTCDTIISYTSIVEPVINQNCATSGCHNSSASGGYTFLSHSDVATNASVILSVINHEPNFAAMPLGQAKLNDTIIQQITCWVEQGTQNN